MRVTIGVPWWTGESLADAEDLVDHGPRGVRRGGDRSETRPLVQAFLLDRFLPLMVLVPVIGAMALVTTSIVDELRGRSLEPLLATPITTLELLVAKAGSAFVVAVLLLAAGTGLFARGRGTPGRARASLDASPRRGRRRWCSAWRRRPRPPP